MHFKKGSIPPWLPQWLPPATKIYMMQNQNAYKFNYADTKAD